MPRKSDRLVAAAAAALPSSSTASALLPRKRKAKGSDSTADAVASDGATAAVSAVKRRKATLPKSALPIRASGGVGKGRSKTAAAVAASVAAAAADVPPPLMMIQPPAHWELPPDVLRCYLLPFVAKPSQLVAVSLAFPGAYDVLSDLPDWAASALEGAEKLAGQPFSIKRALSVLTTSRCELCGRFNEQEMATLPCVLFAHKDCIAACLVNVYNLTADDKARLRSTRAPSITARGYKTDYDRRAGRSWSTVSYWDRRSPLVPECYTVEGVS